MKLYHGSNVKVDTPKLFPTKRLLDFGAGFYLTSDWEQAKKWAIRTANSRGEGAPMVSVFEMEDNNVDFLNIQEFFRKI